jgi:hypothetical protein
LVVYIEIIYRVQTAALWRISGNIGVVGVIALVLSAMVG